MKLIYTVGKDESYINIYDYSLDNIKKCSSFICSKKNYYSLLLNRKYLDKKNKEIDRLIRYTINNEIYYVGFKDKNLINHNCIENIYPNEDLELNHLTTEQWISGNQFIKQKFYIK